MALDAAPAETDPGLVNCSISVPDSLNADDPLAGFRFPQANNLAKKVAEIPLMSAGYFNPDHVIPGVDYRRVKFTKIGISPGSVRLRRSNFRRSEDVLQDREAREIATKLHVHNVIEDIESDERPTRGSITAWSSKSQSRMLETISSLDIASLVNSARDSGLVPAMVTLTSPGDWLSVFPTATAAAKAFRKFQFRWRKKWGRARWIWKREFQRRGAPHWHIWTMLPTTDLAEFKRWLSISWVQCCGTRADPDSMAGLVESASSQDFPILRRMLHGSKCERSKHLLAGTGVDIAEALRDSDPRRLAIYFLKESGNAESKSYQNRSPVAWDGESVGRFWGYAGIKKIVVWIELDEAIQQQVWRCIRKLISRRSPVAYRKVSREKIDYETGEIVTSTAMVQRKRRFSGVGGFVLINDGEAFAGQLARLVQQLLQ